MVVDSCWTNSSRTQIPHHFPFLGINIQSSSICCRWQSNDCSRGSSGQESSAVNFSVASQRGCPALADKPWHPHDATCSQIRKLDVEFDRSSIFSAEAKGLSILFVWQAANPTLLIVSDSCRYRTGRWKLREHNRSVELS